MTEKGILKTSRHADKNHNYLQSHPICNVIFQFKYYESYEIFLSQNKAIRDYKEKFKKYKYWPRFKLMSLSYSKCQYATSHKTSTIVASDYTHKLFFKVNDDLMPIYQFFYFASHQTSRMKAQSDCLSLSCLDVCLTRSQYSSPSDGKAKPSPFLHMAPPLKLSEVPLFLQTCLRCSVSPFWAFSQTFTVSVFGHLKPP